MSSLNLPNDGVPTFGFRQYAFKPKRRCVSCNRRVYVGIINLNDEGREHEPDFRVMCTSCYRALDREDS